MPQSLTVHRFQANLFPVNAYLIESATEVVAIDATLGMSDGRRLRARVDQTGKPLAGVVITHAHPDHYGAVTALVSGLDVQVYSVGGVADAIRRDDADKERILRPMFGDEWATTRTFPTTRVRDGERITVGSVTLRVIDVGPGESPHDSWWVLESDGQPRIFPGDLVYNHMHAYLADGFSTAWLDNLKRAKRELPPDGELLVGHGNPFVGAGMLDWQTGYIEAFLDAVQSGVGKDFPSGDAFVEAVTRRMKQYLPGEDLEFLMRLSVEPTRLRLTEEGRIRGISSERSQMEQIRHSAARGRIPRIDR
jgi:glyoxylase-like metal-dependent hydrolase (beta-lactamase superfamily II)